MIFLKETVDQLNAALKKRLSPYTTAEYYGVSTTAVVNKDGKGAKVYPSVVELNKYDNIDLNNKQFVIYHKAISTSFIYNNTTGNFGNNEVRAITAVTDLSLVVIGQRKGLNVAPEQLALIIADAITGPIKVSEPRLIKSMRTESVSISFDQRRIFLGEYTGIPYFIGPQMFMFSINYRISGIYLQECIKQCEC